MSRDKNQLRMSLEALLGKDLSHLEIRDWKGSPVHGEITLSHVKAANRDRKQNNIKTRACRCAGAYSVVDLMGWSEAAVGNARVMGLPTHMNWLEYAEFYGPEVHIRFDSGRSPQGATYTIRQLRRSATKAVKLPGSHPSKGNRRGITLTSKRAQILKKAFG